MNENMNQIVKMMTYYGVLIDLHLVYKLKIMYGTHVRYTLLYYVKKNILIIIFNQ